MNVKPKESVRSRTYTLNSIRSIWEMCRFRTLCQELKSMEFFSPLVIYCAHFVFVSIQIYFLTFFRFFLLFISFGMWFYFEKVLCELVRASNKPIYANDPILPSDSFQSSIKCEMLWVAIWFHINSVSMLLLLHHYNRHSTVLCALWHHIICVAYAKLLSSINVF